MFFEWMSPLFLASVAKAPLLSGLASAFQNVYVGLYN